MTPPQNRPRRGGEDSFLSGPVVFRQLAVYFVVFEVELILLYPWSASLLPGSLLGSSLGYYGVLPFLACLLVGFGLEIKRDALKL